MSTQRKLMEESIKKFEKFLEEIKKTTGFPIIPEQKTGDAQWISQRKLELKYSISVEKIKKFFEGLLDNKILATKCLKCKEIFFPPQSFCSNCNEEKFEWIELSNEGELITFTKIHIKPYSFSHYDDYVIGILKLKEGINITAWISEKDITKIKVGMKAKLKIVKREPEGYLTYEIQL